MMDNPTGCKIKLAAAVTALGMLIGASNAAAAPSPAAQAQAQACVQSHAALQACLNQTNNPQLAEALLPYAQVTASATANGAPADVTATTRRKPHRRNVKAHAAGCWTDTDQHTIAIAGINVGWQKLYVNYCADPTVRITSTDTHAVRWSGALYCWTNTNDWWVWNHYPTWQDAYASGQLGGDTGFGCIGLQSDKPWIEYNSVGQAWFH